MGALFVGELEEDLLALRVLEAFAVLLEEAVRAALAGDADAQRLLVGHAGAQLVEPLGEQSARGPLEEQERGAILERRIVGEELGVAPLERGEMLALLGGERLEDAAALRVARDPGRAR